MCLAGPVVTFWSLTQEVTCLNNHFTILSLNLKEYSIVSIRNSSCGKVMFSQACVKNSVYMGGGGVRGGRRDGHCSGRYASYWNTFLFMLALMDWTLFSRFISNILSLFIKVDSVYIRNNWHNPSCSLEHDTHCKIITIYSFRIWS